MFSIMSCIEFLVLFGFKCFNTTVRNIYFHHLNNLLSSSYFYLYLNLIIIFVARTYQLQIYNDNFNYFMIYERYNMFYF